MAGNRGQTSLSFNGEYASEWPDGQPHPEDYHMEPGCIYQPNCKFFSRLGHCRVQQISKQLNISRTVHTHNESEAAGTAFAIAYEVCLSHVARNLGTQEVIADAS
jgi:hypothetical protein